MVDKSPQGYIDEDIKDLLETINSIDNYETTSSCSGRIVLINTHDKKKSRWLFKSHEPVSAEDIYENLPGGNKVYLMQEPLIIHLRCRSLESADKVLGICKKLGLKHSGIISLKSLTVEIRGTNRIETVLDKDLVTKEYIELLVSEANRKLLKTKQKISELEKEFKKIKKINAFSKEG